MRESLAQQLELPWNLTLCGAGHGCAKFGSPEVQGLTFLNVIQPVSQRPQPLFVTTTTEVMCSDGFHEEEREHGQPFRWMTEHGALTFAAGPLERYLELWTLSEFHDLSQRLSVEAVTLAQRHGDRPGDQRRLRSHGGRWPLTLRDSNTMRTRGGPRACQQRRGEHRPP